MPEGDTIHRAARTLRLALVGTPVTRFWAHRPHLLQPTREGRTVESVAAHGKNLLIGFNDGRTLYTHMLMTGSWHVYRPDEPWRKSEGGTRLVIENENYVAVCFRAPVVELLTVPEMERHPVLTQLGPDFLAEEFDEDEAVRRYRDAGDEEAIGDLLLDQTRAAGIGNVYKSEMLFLMGIHPFTAQSQIPEERLRTLLRRTREMMRRNLTLPKRTTRSGPGSLLWVYERGGQQCFRCRTRIDRVTQGEYSRSTYFCASCQPANASSTATQPTRSGI